MENEQLNREIESYPRLSIEEMLKLSENVENWRATSITRHVNEYSYFHPPKVYGFKGRLGEITLDLESSIENFSQRYSLTASSTRNILGYYQEKEGKCPPKLVELFSSLETRFLQRYSERVKFDLDEARKLIQ